MIMMMLYLLLLSAVPVVAVTLVVSDAGGFRRSGEVKGGGLLSL